MNAWEQALAAFSPRPMDQLFDELAQLGRRWKQGAPVVLPGVTLHLHSGRDVPGALVDVFEPRMGGGRTLLVSRRGPGRRPDTELLLVPVAHVEAVTLHELPSSTASTPPEEVPSGLQLKRQVKALTEQLASLLGAPLAVEVAPAGDEAGLKALGRALPALSQVLAGVCADELGRSALKTAVTSVVLSAGPEPSVTLRDGALSVVTAPESPLSAEALKAQLEALL